MPPQRPAGRPGTPAASLFEDSTGDLAADGAPTPLAGPGRLLPEPDFGREGDPFAHEFEERWEDLFTRLARGGGLRATFRKVATSAICALIAFSIASVAAGLLHSHHPQRHSASVDRLISAANPAPSPGQQPVSGLTPRRQTGRRRAFRPLVGAHASRRVYTGRASRQVAVKSAVTHPPVTGASPQPNEDEVQTSEPPPTEPVPASEPAPAPELATASAAPTPASSERASPPVDPTPATQTAPPAQGGAAAEFRLRKLARDLTTPSHEIAIWSPNALLALVPNRRRCRTIAASRRGRPPDSICDVPRAAGPKENPDCRGRGRGGRAAIRGVRSRRGRARADHPQRGLQRQRRTN